MFSKKQSSEVCISKWKQGFPLYQELLLHKELYCFFFLFPSGQIKHCSFQYQRQPVRNNNNKNTLLNTHANSILLSLPSSYCMSHVAHAPPHSPFLIHSNKFKKGQTTWCFSICFKLIQLPRCPLVLLLMMFIILSLHFKKSFFHHIVRWEKWDKLMHCNIVRLYMGLLD